MSSLTEWMDREWYPGYSKNWDDAMFRERVLACLKPEHLLLDLGAGAGIVGHMNFKGRAARVCGVDLDPRVTENPFLDEGRVSDAGKIPYGDESFDIVVSDNVLEHLDTPCDVFREVARVLRPGGLFFFKTPNKWHYMPTIARITPHSFHQFVNRVRGRAEVDTFPTRYRANTKSAIGILAKESGFNVVSLDRVEGRPEYLRMTAGTYLLGVAYERLVNSSSAFEPFRILLIGTLRKL